MTLSELITNLPDKKIIGNADAAVNGIAYDSRKVGNDFIFAAIKGEHFDGGKFIHDAIQHGATAILTENTVEDDGATHIVVPDVREAMAKLAAVLYGEPSRKISLVGVTGTNGKTTITYLVESIIKVAGFFAGVVGTINYRYQDKIVDAPHTTPEAPDLQKIFKDMTDSGITHCVMEVSSHALAQKRVFGSRFIGAVFTNLTRDHLDYHKTMEEYFESKAKLFTDFVAKEENGFAVINMDDDWGKTLRKRVKGQGSRVKTFGYGLKNSAEIEPVRAAFSERGIEASLNTPIGSVKISSPLLGEYNLQNIMAAVGVGIGLGFDRQIIENGIANLARVSGRLERIISDDGFQAVVDYAHTGDALERALNTLRPLTKGRLITVFGCGGDRDRGKRPIMGEIATRLSDFTIITSDNPRSEGPMEIIKEIEIGIGVKGQGSRVNGYAVIPDRHEAIKAAVSMAEANDIIFLAGKGHEDYQIIGNKKFHFDDTEEIEKAIKERSQKSEAKSQKTGTK